MKTVNNNLYVALRKAFPANLDTTAVETADGNPRYYTWRDIDRATARIANMLQWLKLPPGSRVAVHVDKSVEALLLYLAVLRAGYVYLPLNTAYKAAELEYFIEHAEPKVLVCSSQDFSWVGDLAAKARTRHVYTLDADGTGSLLSRAAAHSDEHEPAHRVANDLAAILYTSGTTGRSKGAMLTHGNLLSNARVLKDYWGWRQGDVLIHALPIFHVHGLFVASHGALLNGSKMIWFNRFAPHPVIERLPEATVFMGVPTMYVRLLGEAGFGRDACRNMRLFVSGSAPLLIETFNEFRDRTGHTVLERYGMSETLMIASNAYHPEHGERRGGTVGFALPGVQVRVRDKRRKVVPPGEIGGIEVRGPNVFRGYWRMPAKTRDELSRGGWFKTGDLGKVDEHGHLVIVGRSKDLIITGGYNVYPAEVEAYLNEMDEVAESAVFGVLHPDYGEGVLAAVVPTAGAKPQPEALVAALKAKIAGFKVPKQVFVVDDLPRNAMGKVQKNVLREHHKDVFSGANC